MRALAAEPRAAAAIGARLKAHVRVPNDVDTNAARLLAGYRAAIARAGGRT
jgi:hypothetical protein